MNPVKIIVKSGEGRKVNPYGYVKGHIDKEYQKACNEIWKKFDRESKSYPAPGIKDGTHMARLQWQYLLYDRWTDFDKENELSYYSPRYRTRQIWVLSPDGEGEKKTDEQIELLKKDFFGSADYLSGVNDGMYHLKAHTIELKISDFCIVMEDVERAFCFGYITNPDNNCLDNAEMMRRWQAFKTEYLDHKIIE